MESDHGTGEEDWARTPLKIGMGVVAAIAVLVPSWFGMPALALAGAALWLSFAVALSAVSDPLRFAAAVHVACGLGLFVAAYAVFGYGWSPVMTVYVSTFVLLALAQLLGAPAALAWCLPCVILVATASFRPPAVLHDVPEWLAFGVRLSVVLTTLGFALSFRHARDQQARELERRARTDGLTGLINRGELMRSLERAHARCRRFDRSYGLIYIDLDGLKALNDAFGHAAGDALIQSCAERIRSVTREVDIAARLGGDEFVVLLTEVDDATGCVVLARRLLEVLGESFLYEGRSIPTAASLGVALHGPEDSSETAQQALDRADSAMYAAKSAGGARIHVDGHDILDGPVPLAQLEDPVEVEEGR